MRELQRARQARLAVWLLHAELRQCRHLRRNLLPVQPVRSPRRLRPRQLRHPQPLPAGRQSAGPYGVSFSPMLVANSGAPFNITIGQDLNGDNQFNDRPAYATAASTDVMKTQWGTFDLEPVGQRDAHSLQPGHRSRPVQHEHAGQQVVRHRPKGRPAPAPTAACSADPADRLRAAAAVDLPGGGLGPGGLSGNRGGPPGMNQAAATRRYSLTFAAMAPQRLQQREPGAAGAGARHRRCSANPTLWQEASSPRPPPTAASTCRCRSTSNSNNPVRRSEKVKGASGPSLFHFFTPLRYLNHSID